MGWPQRRTSIPTKKRWCWSHGFCIPLSRLWIWPENKPTTTRGNQFLPSPRQMLQGRGRGNGGLRNVGKEELKESPFIKYFEFGMDNEGYWGCSHMVTQLEDCVDCVKVMYPQFDFIFLFDHSSGHSKKRIGGLDASSMNKEFGGA